MVSLFVGSVAKYSGKNVLSLALGTIMKRNGAKVGYFKPLGVVPVRVGNTLTDESVAFFRRSLNLTDPLESMCPVVLTDALVDEVLGGRDIGYRERVLSHFSEIIKGKDVVFVCGLGGGIANGLFLGMSERDFVEETGSKAILTDTLEYVNESVDMLLRAKNLLKEHLVGVLFNRVHKGKVELLKNKVAPFLRNKGVELFGVLPEDAIIGSVSVRDLHNMLGGEVLCCEDKLDDLVERFAVGAMSVDSAIRYFRKTPNKAVITGGDRSDIQLAALETSTKALLLTGDLYPNDLILGRALELDVPIIVVKADTLTAVEKCESILGRQTIHDERKVQRAIQLIQQNVDLNLLAEKVGIDKQLLQ